MSSKAILRYFRFYVLPLIFLAGGSAFFINWAESEMRIPGGFRDVQFWEDVMSSSDVVGDLLPLSGYLHQRTAEILVASKRSTEGLLLFEFMDRIIRTAAPERRLPDLKYAFAVYKSQLFISSAPSLKLYNNFRRNLKLEKTYAYSGQFLFKSDFQKKTLIALRKAEKEEDVSAVILRYQKALEHPEFSAGRADLILQLAYFLYEKNSPDASAWIQKLENQNPGPALQIAAAHLKRKIQKTSQGKPGLKKSVSLESQLVAFMTVGLFEQAAQVLKTAPPQSLSDQMNEIGAWLNETSEAKMQAKRSFLSEYFHTLRNMPAQPVKISERLANLATDKGAWGYGAILRYQAWALAYFDAKNYGQASFFSQLLKTRDPMSSYSQLESMKGLFQPSEKFYEGSQLLQLWKAEPYRFEMIQKKANWIGFQNSSNRVSQTMVHEGQVYVLNYNDQGQVINLRTALAGENVEEKRIKQKKETILKESAKTGLMDSFILDYMIRYIPLGVRTFKQQLQAAQNIKDPIFTRFYSADEFQIHILDKMRPSMGSAISQIYGEIEENGFRLYALLDSKSIKISATGLGKLLVEGDGQLILKLDHVKVGRVYLPDWLLRRVEKNFNRAANFDGSIQPGGVDILEMKYRKSGILITCQKKT